MSHKKNSTIQTIPIHLCHLALKLHKVNQLKVFIAMKIDGSGYFQANGENTKRITDLLKISTVTFRKYLRELSKDGWIIKCKTKNIFWIRGYQQMGILLKNKTISCVRFENKDLLTFKALLIAVEYAKIIKFLRRKGLGPVRTESWRTLIRALPPSTFIVANTYFAKSLGISTTSAIEYKALAEKAGYIKTGENLYRVHISPQNIENYSEAHGLSKSRFVRRNGEVFYQKPDIIESKILIYYRRNLKRKKSDP